MENEIQGQFKETESILETVPNDVALEYAKWVQEKAKIKFRRLMPRFPITSNYIYWCNLGVNIGSEQNKIRPAVIVRVQTDSPNCTVLPLTSERVKDNKWYHIDLEEKTSTALIEQVRNISKLRILGPKRTKGILERITLNDFTKINNALSKYYKLQDFPKKKQEKD